MDKNNKPEAPQPPHTIQTNAGQTPSQYVAAQPTPIKQNCNLCNHTLENNNHGFDQNDAWLEGDKLIHSGKCTYCIYCNPRLKELKDAKIKKDENL